MPKEKAKPIFEAAGMDFFDQHPYTFNVDDFKKEADFDGPSVRSPLQNGAAKR